MSTPVPPAADSPASAGSEPPHPPTGTPRAVWILVFTLTAVIVGGTAALLAHASGTPAPAAILTGGTAFAGTLGLLLAVAHYATGDR